jgi:hypothetical protein
LREFENRVLRKVFEPEGFELTGGWRRARVEELQICTNIMKKNEMGWECSKHRGERKTHTGFCYGNLRKETNWKT